MCINAGASGDNAHDEGYPSQPFAAHLRPNRLGRGRGLGLLHLLRGGWDDGQRLGLLSLFTGLHMTQDVQSGSDFLEGFWESIQD